MSTVRDAHKAARLARYTRKALRSQLVCCAAKPIEAAQRESARDDGRSRASLGCDGGDADIYFGMFEKDWHRIGENFDNIFEECGKILGNDLIWLLWIGDGNMTATGIFRLLSGLKT